MAQPSSRSRSVALLLAVVLGVVGAHRFYTGKIGTGLLMIVTGGGLGIWYLIDVVKIASGSFRDVDGRRVSRWDPEESSQFDDLPPELLAELDNLRQDVNDLALRLDFAERLLADPDRSRRRDE